MTKYQIIRLAWFQQLEIAQKEQEHAKKHPSIVADARAKKEQAKADELYNLMGKYESFDEIME